MPPSPSDPSMIGVKPPHMGPVAHGFAVLGNAAEHAVSTVAAFAADAAQAPCRLGQAAALLTADGRLGAVWQVMAPFAGLLFGAMAVALAVHPPAGTAADSAGDIAAVERCTFRTGIAAFVGGRYGAPRCLRLPRRRWQLFAVLGPRARLLPHPNLPHGSQSRRQLFRRRVSPGCGAVASVGRWQVGLALRSTRRSGRRGDAPIYRADRRARRNQLDHWRGPLF